MRYRSIIANTARQQNSTASGYYVSPSAYERIEVDKDNVNEVVAEPARVCGTLAGATGKEEIVVS